MRKAKQKALKGADALSAVPPFPDLSSLKALLKPKTLMLVASEPVKGEAKLLSEDRKQSWADITEEDEASEAAKLLVKQIFKADHPYRTQIGLMSSLNSSGSGAVNLSIGTTSITSTQEWGSIDALFDEFFIHTMKIIFTPRNVEGYGSSPAGLAAINTTTTQSSLITSCGLIMVSLFTNAGTYGTAAGMVSNPTHTIKQSTKKWSYTWRNNVKFDPQGASSSASTWQGWCPITSSASYGGLIQLRAMNDVTVGDGVHLHTFGDYITMFDVSFRSRA